MNATVRVAETRDLPLLPPIEASGDALFGERGIVFQPGPTVIEQMGDDIRILVLGDPPIGFAEISDIDGRPYLEQISVHAEPTATGSMRSPTSCVWPRSRR